MSEITSFQVRIKPFVQRSSDNVLKDKEVIELICKEIIWMSAK